MFFLSANSSLEQVTYKLLHQFFLVRFLRGSVGGDSELVRLRREDVRGGGVIATPGDPRDRFDGVTSSTGVSLGLTRPLLADCPKPNELICVKSEKKLSFFIILLCRFAHFVQNDLTENKS